MIAKHLTDAISGAFTPNEAIQRFPGRPSLQCVNRWMNTGVMGPGGQRIRLRSVKIGGRRYIPESAIAEFIEACNAEPSGRPQNDAVSEAQAAQRAAAASKALEALGC